VGVSEGAATLTNSAGELDIPKNAYGFAENFNTPPQRLLSPPASLQEEGSISLEASDDDEEGSDDGDAEDGDADGESDSDEDKSDDSDSEDSGSDDEGSGSEEGSTEEGSTEEGSTEENSSTEEVAQSERTLTLAPTVMLQVKVARINLVRMMVGKLMAALAQDTRKSLQNLAVERRPCLRRLQRGP